MRDLTRPVDPERELEMFTVYKRPRDFPSWFVVRRFIIGGDNPEPQPMNIVAVCDTLDEARRAIPPGKTPLSRSPGDEPQIVETWL